MYDVFINLRRKLPQEKSISRIVFEIADILEICNLSI